jgi:NitT/TauT family transport system ATP-binding protein
MVTHSISEGVFMATRLVVMGAHPGSIRAVFDNAMPYPRDEHHPDFVGLIQKLHALITQTVFPAPITPTATTGDGTLPVQSIPGVSLSSAIGVLEMLENEGSMELFDLTRHAHVELSQLLLVVKASEMLGWVTTPGGRVEMTVAGRQFLAADIKTRKQLLNTTLRGLFVFDLVVQALRRSASSEVDESVVLDQLARAFPNEQPPRILRTVVAWARYAELFKYSGLRRVFHGLQQTPVGLGPMDGGRPIA